MAAMFLGNTVCCVVIISIGAWKRSQYRNRLAGSEPYRAALRPNVP